MVALVIVHIIHDATPDVVVLGSLVNDDAVISVATHGNRGVHLAGDDLRPVEEMLNDAVVVVVTICVQITKNDGVPLWNSNQGFEVGEFI